MLVSEVKGEAQLVSRNELRYFFATRSNQTIYYARVMDSRPPDANAMLEYASLRLLAGDSAGYKRLCARLVERDGDTSDLGIVDNLSRVCTLAPVAVDDPAWPVAWSDHIWMSRKPRPPVDPPFPRGRLLPRRPVRRGDPALPGVPAARPDLAGPVHERRLPGAGPCPPGSA